MHKIITALKLLRNPRDFWTVVVIRLSWCKPFMALVFAWTDFKYSGAARRAKRRGELPVPPASLRFRIGNTLSRNVFIHTGQQSNKTIKDALQRVGKNLGDFHDILDFGCGCGRMARGMLQDAPHARIYGTDIDEQTIAWCQANLHPAQFTVNAPHPALQHQDATFDLIYSHSVFTHIDEESGLLWLQEFHRLLQPGGYAIFTVHGEHVWKNLPAPQIEQMKQHGFLFLEPHLAETDGAFHTPEYLERVTAAQYDFLNYIPRAMLAYQDVVVLRKK
jgi:SAM-dependent methyltransferase